jgi:hypothetical protein
MSRILSCLGLALMLAMWVAVAGATPKGKKVSLTVEGTIAGAKVLVDGKEIGKTPLKNKEITPGAHTIVVRKLGYVDFSAKIQVKPGKPVSVFADLLPFAGVIKVSSNVGKAMVLVDGKQVGRVPLEYEVKLGQHTVTVSAPGYASYSQIVNADPGNEYEIRGNLTKGDAAGTPADGGLELALVPLGGPTGGDKAQSTSGGKSRGSGGGKSPPPGGAGGLDELALVPMAGPSPPIGGGSRAGVDSGLEMPAANDGLALEPLATPPLELMAISATSGGPIGPTSGVVTAVQPVKPWYMEYWAWSAAAAVVVTGASVGIWAVKHRGRKNCETVEICFDTDPETGGNKGSCKVCY